MTDFNSPILTTNKDVVLSILNDKINSVAKLDYTGDTNIPTNAVRWNTNGYIDKWNGSTWVAQGVGLLKTGTVGTDSIINDAVTAPKIRFANNTFLRGNDTGGTVRDIVGLNSANELSLNSYGGVGVRIRDNGTEKWQIGNDILPATNAARVIGSNSLALLNLHSVNYTAYETFIGNNGGNGDLNLATAGGNGLIYFKTSSTARFFMTQYGIYPSQQNAQDLGGSNNQFRTLYLNNLITAGSTNLTIRPSGLLTLGGRNTDCLTVDPSQAWGMLPINSQPSYLGSPSSPFWYGYFSQVGGTTYPVSNIYALSIRSETGINYYTKTAAHRFFGYDNNSEPAFALTNRNWFDGWRMYPYFRSDMAMSVGYSNRVANHGNIVPDLWLRVEVGPGSFYGIKLYNLNVN